MFRLKDGQWRRDSAPLGWFSRAISPYLLIKCHFRMHWRLLALKVDKWQITNSDFNPYVNRIRQALYRPLTRRARHLRSQVATTSSPLADW
jgi:hypothetical protein